MPTTMPIGFVMLESAVVEPNIKSIKKGDNGRPIAEAVVQTAEEDNRNGRAYLHPDLYREITCPRTMELTASGNMKAENGHPMDSSMVRQQTIDPNNTVAKFLKFYMQGNDVLSIFKGTNNALGHELDEDLKDGELPSWSLRALGSLETVRGRNIVRNLKLITYDRVIYPSHPGAYTKRLISESAFSKSSSEIAFNKFHDQVNESGILIPIMNEDVMSYIKQESANIANVLNQIDIFYESVKLVGRNRVQMTSKAGDIFMINLESHIQNEIQNYCANI